MNGRCILTAAETRTAEAKAIEDGISVETLMERAGAGAAEAVWRFAGPLPALVICGPGNNGGDGYVIARLLRERNVDVRVAALAEPQGGAAQTACSRWGGPIEKLGEARDAPLLIDALFGTGLTRPLDPAAAAALARLAAAAKLNIAVDLPSGAGSDDGSLLSQVPDYHLTITFGALKPSHLLQPAAAHIGRLVLADIGIVATGRLFEIARPILSPPGPRDHKYSRGYVAVLAGEMPGAASLAAAASLRAGAGYVRLIGDVPAADLPNAIIRDRASDAISDGRIGALVVGPGLGRSDRAGVILDQALDAGRPLIVDADALHLLAGRLDRLAAQSEWPILTPHQGEFERLFTASGSKVERARAAACDAQAVVVFKGADTVVAAPDGRAALAPPNPSWLATAGTGDVLSGIIAAMRARGLDSFEAACAGVWVHGRAAEAVGPMLIADDIVAQLPGVVAGCA